MKMRNLSKLLCVAIVCAGFSLNARSQCPDGIYYPDRISNNAFGGWSSSDWYPILNLDAEKLTDARYPRTGATSGADENMNYSDNSLKKPVGSGVIELPLYDVDENSGEMYDSGKKYQVTYRHCVFAPDHYTSAYSKLNEGRNSELSGALNACEINDNTVLTGGVFKKKGFIELNREQSTEAEGSKHGYIQLDGLRAIDKIQWSYSSTAWKRGVICEKRMAGSTEWTALRSLPSERKYYVTFAEQGYEFEELFDPNSDEEFSVRFRIWDGDDTTWEDELDLDPSERSPAYFYIPVNPYARWQTARIHQIKVYAAINGSELETPTGLSDHRAEGFEIHREGTKVLSSAECQFELYAVDGCVIKRERGCQLDIAGFSQGIYLVKATTNNGLSKQLKVIL